MEIFCNIENVLIVSLMLKKIFFNIACIKDVNVYKLNY